MIDYLKHQKILREGIDYNPYYLEGPIFCVIESKVDGVIKASYFVVGEIDIRNYTPAWKSIEIRVEIHERAVYGGGVVYQLNQIKYDRIKQVWVEYVDISYFDQLYPIGSTRKRVGNFRMIWERR